MPKLAIRASLTAIKSCIFVFWLRFGLYRPQRRTYIALIHFNMPYATFISTIVYLDSPLEAPGANIGNPSVFNGYKRLQTATNGYISECLPSFDLHRPVIRQHIFLIHFIIPYTTFISTIVYLDLALEAPGGPNRTQRLY